MAKKPGRVCKICKLKKTHPKAHKRITTQIMEGSGLSISKLLKILNKEFNINITPMNYQSHKGHTLDGKVHILKPVVEANLPANVDIQEVIKNLNPKHKLFCEFYVNECNHNGSKAYKKVYGTDNAEQTSRGYAWKIKTNINNTLYIKYLEDIKREEIGVNENYIYQQLKSVVDRCMQNEPVLNKEGEETGEYTFNAVGANKALAELGKYLGMGVKKEAPPDQELYKKILEDFIGNRLNPLAASVELEKAGIEMPELLKIAMRKAELPEAPIHTDDLGLGDMTDDELQRLEAELS